MRVCVPSVYSAHRVQKSVSDSLELELQTVSLILFLNLKMGTIASNSQRCRKTQRMVPVKCLTQLRLGLESGLRGLSR